MNRPSFIVVTSVVVTLSIVGVAARLVLPSIPPPAPNRLLESTQPFLRQAGRQPVDWHLNSDSAFAQARRDNKPILFLVGVPWSGFARRMDQKVFRDQDVARYLARNFVCIRVDATMDRKLLAAFLPYSRMAIGLQPGFQAWVLDSQGKVLDFIGRQNINQEFDSEKFLAALIEAKDTVDKGNSPERVGTPSGQVLDLAFLRQSERLIRPDFSAYRLTLARLVDSKVGGFPVGGFQPLLPNAYRYELIAGGSPAFYRSIYPVLYSPLADLLDGGFFRLRSLNNPPQVEFDKVATLNAEMAAMLAQAACTTADESLKFWARQAFDGILNTLVKDQWIGTCRTGEVGEDLRSERYSMGLARLHGSMSDAEVDWLEDNLGLRPAANPQMIPFYASPASLRRNRARGDALMSALRSGAPAAGTLCGLGQTEPHTFSLARMMETARLLGDAPRMARLRPLITAAEQVRLSDRVLSGIDTRQESEYLGDWLGVADLEFQVYLATGDVERLKAGATILREACERFGTDVPGEYVVGSDRERVLGPQEVDAPEVADNVQESCSARLIRLCAAYGSLLTGSRVGLEFTRRSDAAIELYSSSLREAGPRAAGYFSAALLAERPYALVAGPESVAKAAKLARLAPFNLVAPTAAKRLPGVYVVDHGKTIGPLSISAAAARLALPNDFAP